MPERVLSVRKGSAVDLLWLRECSTQAGVSTNSDLVQGLDKLTAEERATFYAAFTVPKKAATAFDKAHPPPEPVESPPPTKKRRVSKKAKAAEEEEHNGDDDAEKADDADGGNAEAGKAGEEEGQEAGEAEAVRAAA